MTLETPQCCDCKNLIIPITNKKFICPAFPEGIPIEILNNNFKHTKKHPDQQGDLLFDEDEGKFFREQK